MGVDGTVSRRTVLKGAIVGVVSAAVAACSTRVDEVAPAAAVVRPLPIPPLLAPRKVGKAKVFRLQAQPGTSELRPGVRTATCGYNGATLGPTIRVRRGDTVRFKVGNALTDDTYVHWHGLHVPPTADAGPHRPIRPGDTQDVRFVIRQQAATCWYHPDLPGSSAVQTYRGLAGMLIVDDAPSAALDLPHEYGVDDIPLILQDKKFTPTGALDEAVRPDVGLLGDTLTVNGISDPTFTATTRRVRFRVVDASPSRLYNLAFADDRRFTVIASDGGLLDKTRSVTSLMLSPGERAEIVVDLTPGETVVLRAVRFPDDSGIDDAADLGLDDEFDVLTIVGPGFTAERPGTLRDGLNKTLRNLPSVGLAKRRYFDLQWLQINGQLMDPARIDAVVDVGEDEVWTVRNKDSQVANFHVHGTQFRVLTLKGTSLRPQIEGWKDTVLLPPDAVATLAVRFTDYTSTRHPYLFGSQLMPRWDNGMSGQLIVVKPGQKRSAVLSEKPTKRRPRPTTSTPTTSPAPR